MRHPLLPLSFMLVTFLYGATANAQEGAGKQFGEKVDRAVSRMREGAADLASQLREGFGKVRESVHQMNVAARVYARLHWDKRLNDADISVRVSQPGVAELSGTVRTEEDKRHAEQLADGTVGVERVVNGLAIAPVQEPAKPANRPK